MIKETAGDTLLGAAQNTAVLIDETFVTKKRRNRGGFRGRDTTGTKTILFGGVELDLMTRTCTGRAFLIQVPDRRRQTLERHIRERIAPGALIWTDGHASYKFLGLGAPERGALSPRSGFRWDWVNHAQGEFARGDVSTNAVEGLFSRLKKSLRASRITKIHQQDYGIYLENFCGGKDFYQRRAWALQTGAIMRSGNLLKCFLNPMKQS